MYIFISCASQDAQIGERLKEDLKRQNVSPFIYTESIKPGKIWLEEIDKALAEADYVLGVITKHYFSSMGSVEAFGKIIEGLKERDIRFIPLFFVPPEEIKSTIMKTIQGINFTKEYSNGLYQLLEFLKDQEPESAKVLLSRVESPESFNPFRRVRAEFFRDNYELLARAFATPEKEKYDLLQENKPVFIFGGRGCGKTMILKSLTPRVLLYRLGISNYEEARERRVNFLGIYFRLEKGSLLLYDYNNLIEMGFMKTNLPKDYDLYRKLLQKLNKERRISPEFIEGEPVLTAGLNAVWVITLNEINLKILKTILKELKDLSTSPDNIIILEEHEERKITEDIMEKLKTGETTIENFQGLIRFIDNELSKISRYIQDLSIPHAEPKVDWCRTDIKFLDRIFPIITNNAKELRGITFYLLFDEFENLRQIQQTIIIEWVKTADNFVPKIASKFEGMYTNMTLQGQPLQFGEDCPDPIELDYNLFDHSKRKNYQELLIKICSSLMQIEGYKNDGIREILEEPKGPEMTQYEIDEEIKKTRVNAGQEFKSEKIREYRNKLQVAAIFRLLRERRKVEGRKSRRKICAGFETYSYLSSGIIRIFLNLVGMALYKAENEQIDVKNGEKIPVDHQSWAAYTVSKAWLEKIPENYDFMGYGEQIYQFIVDIGDILRERLLNHPTEPESLCITLSDPINLNKEQNAILSDIFAYCERESIFYKRKETSAYKPKHAESRAREYILNRIYSPVLGLSYRTRWGRNKFTAAELRGLLDERKRKKKIRNLQKKVGKRGIDGENTLNGIVEVENG